MPRWVVIYNCVNCVELRTLRSSHPFAKAKRQCAAHVKRGHAYVN
jgi:hypothetical protein